MSKGTETETETTENGNGKIQSFFTLCYSKGVKRNGKRLRQPRSEIHLLLDITIPIQKNGLTIRSIMHS